MNDNDSKTATAERLSDTEWLENKWNRTDWKAVQNSVKRLQTRIAKATKENKWNTVKRLQYLITHSYNAKLMAVKRVTTNKGKRTAGIDRELWTTPASKMRAVLSLTDKRYKSRPLRRIYIDKKNKKAKRPLGIPTMYDRAMQALYAIALEPVAETTADSRSFGFRQYRSCHDACEYIFSALSQKISPVWVLEGDIKGCFDNINHEWLINNIPTDKSVLKQFLKAGYIFNGELFPTDKGTPQGGIISPILANMTLDGMQGVLEERFHKNQDGKYSRRTRAKHKVNFIRYADDFIVTANTEETALEAKEILKKFLRERGLELSEEKTMITHIDKGFDFLGWTFRKFNGKLIIKPSKKSINGFTGTLSDLILGKAKAWLQDNLIYQLNMKLRGWLNYYETVCSKQTFTYIDYVLFQMLWKWAKRRHPRKGRKWIINRYWHRKGNRRWVFSGENAVLITASHTKIVRHSKIRLDMNPYFDYEYFMEKKFRQGMTRLTGKFRKLWNIQKGCCYLCGMPIDSTEQHEIIITSITGNMAFVHTDCKPLFSQVTARKGDKIPELYDSETVTYSS